MKKVLYFATAALALSACSSDDFLGEDRPNLGGAEELAISLDGGTGVLTRAAKTGSDAATALGENFVVYGFKTTGATKQKVYDHYNVNYVDGSALSTLSNTAGWEYVNQPFSVLTGLTTTDNSQEIKYWDLAADQYDFVAFSAGGNTIVNTGTPTDDQLLFSQVNNATLKTAAYTIQGSVADLAEAFIADRVTATKTASVIANRQYPYKDAIQFNFRSLSSKVRMAIYETVPGYSVKEVMFYPSAAGDAVATTTPVLYAASATIPAGTGTMTVSFPEEDNTKTDFNKAHVSYAPAAGSANVSKIDFSALTYTTAEQLEAAGSIYLGRTSATATFAGNATAADHAYITVLPAEAGALTLKVDFTLVAKDGSGETIDIKGATAVVPAQYCTWQPNYAYTYIFKISDKVSDGTGTAFLYPITFDAIVTETEDGIQETITEVTTPSITTYQAGKVVTANDEYKAGNIYVAVEGTPTLTEGTNYNLYTATVETGALQGITEASVENCLKNAKTYTAVTAGTNLTVGTTYYTSNKGAGKFTVTAENASSYVNVAADTYYTAAAVSASGPWTVTDAAGKALTLTLANGVIEPATKIPATDSPTGDDLTINCAVITASASTVYVFEYIDGSSKKHYKVIKVAAGS